ncbi:hypothetical protein [Paenibacillus caui]|uniref:hypothetical protein n=1 Tax=Paenibacillus caui TaxID=2873927 RepID=UPI001CA92BAC|nr:hypothetical protein [Paenibacillus caui]
MMLDQAIRRSRFISLFLFFCAAAALFTSTPRAAAEALSAQAAVVTTAADFGSGWNNALSSIDGLYDSFTALESIIRLEKQEIQALRSKNNDQLKALNAKIKMIDKAKIDRLKLEAEQAQKKNAPLLKEYAALGKQAAEARKRKDKKAADLLDLKRNKLKASVEAARLENRLKNEALSEAKKQATAKAKVVKDALAPVQTLKKQITAENKKITSANKSMTAAGKRYRAAVKQGNAIAAAAEMTLMYGELGHIHASLKNIYGWEGQIASMLRAAEAKLPK